MSDDSPLADEWNITLNRYQRDNLVWLLAAVGYPFGGDDIGVEPFTLANSGDWVGEIASALDCEHAGSPNMSIAELRQEVERWQKG